MNSIEKQILLRASRTRVWRALSDSTEFGTWFGMKLDGPFAPGSHVHAMIAPTTLNADVASLQKEHEGLRFEILIEQMEPERLFSFRWHPHGVTAIILQSR